MPASPIANILATLSRARAATLVDMRIACTAHCSHQRRLVAQRANQESLGDPYFPQLGNGGYDALHYDLNLKVEPNKQHLEASATMTARALEQLAAFNLDFRNFDISRVVVNGEEAAFERKEGELTITPPAPLPANEEFQVTVDYAGTPKSYHSPHAPVPIGWNAIGDGSYVMSEPDGSSTWYPVNDHPRDKATYTFRVDVPNGYQAVCNGQLVETRPQGDRTTYIWDAKDPMASYLSTVNIGKFVEHKDVGPNQVPIHNFYPERLAPLARIDFGRVPEMMQWLGERFGDYPFEAYGNVVVNASVGGAALETQTRPVYERGMVTGTRALEFVYAHELAHQWWGNSVSVADWKDIWLSEGFACYTENMWRHEHSGGIARLDKAMDRMYRNLPQRSAPVADPGEEDLFSGNVYQRGAVTLHALRKEIGDETFFRTLRTYADRFRGKNVTTDDFVATVNEVTGKDLTAFFDRWVRQPELPPFPKAA